MFRRLTLCSVGGVFCPWRYWMMANEEDAVTELGIESTAGNIKPGRFTSRITFGPIRLQ